MRRNCDLCGVEYETTSKRSRFCGVTCRSRAHRAGGAPKGAPAVRLPVTPPEDVPSNVDVTREVLEQADRLRTPAGIGALTLAAKLDAGGDTGSALAALQKQHMAALELALRDVKVAESPLDELRARREARLAG